MSTKPSRLFVGKVKKKAIGLETLLRISQHGEGAYLFIPRDVVDCYRLLPGDRVKVRLVESFRLISGAEEEEKDRACGERIEPVLAVPRQRRRRKPNLDSDIEPQESIDKQDLEEEENGIDEGEL